MKFDYCPKCGEKLIERPIGDEGNVPCCEKCGRPFFPFSYPCVICLCENEDGEVVLIRQSYGHQRFVCVAGYIKSGECAEDTCIREVAEEIGLEVIGLKFLYSRYFAKNDNLMLAFVCKVRKNIFTLSSEVSEARWFTPEDAEKTLFEGALGVEMLHELKKMMDRGEFI